MSVRRLAAEQPASFAFRPEVLETAHWWLKKYPADRRQSAASGVVGEKQRDGDECELDQ